MSVWVYQSIVKFIELPVIPFGMLRELRGIHVLHSEYPSGKIATVIDT